MRIHRIYAIILRHLFIFKNSYDHLTEVFYWPAIDLFLWGITSSYFQGYIQKTSPNAVTQIVLMIVTGLMLWIFVWRSQHEISMNVLEEMWNKNLVNLFVSPLKIEELITASLIMGMIKAIFGFLFIALLALFFYKIFIFQYLLRLFPLIIILIISGWSIGFFIAGLILRYGTKVQILAWSFVALISPFSAIYYPVSILPSWAQAISHLIPTSYMFEGARAILVSGKMNPMNLGIGLLLAVFYLGVSLVFYKHCFAKTLEKGLIKVF